MDNENIINKYKYIIFGYNLYITRAKLSEYWAIDVTINFIFVQMEIRLENYIQKRRCGMVHKTLSNNDERFI